MNEEIKNFIKENKDLIQNERWEEIYKKDFPDGFTEAILDCGINPLEQGLNYIPKYFLYKSDIKEFIISNNVTSIGSSAFEECRSLKSIEIPDSVTSIGSDAFYNCKLLASVVIGDNVTSIGNYAFYNCKLLASVVIGDNVTSIGNYAFYGCNSLTSIEIPGSVTSIGDDVFYNCTSLAKLNYKGTKEEAIELGIGNKSKKKWREGSPIKKIICRDGIIEL